MKNLICILPSDCEDFQKNIVSKKAQIESKMDRFHSAFNGNLFVGSTCYQNQYLESTSLIADLASNKSIPLVALNNVLFLKKDDHLAHQAKVAINNTSLLKDEIDNPNISNEQYFKNFDQMKELHPNEALKNSVHIAKMCNLIVGEGEYFLPSFEVTESNTLDGFLKKISSDKLG